MLILQDPKWRLLIVALFLASKTPLPYGESLQMGLGGTACRGP